MAERIHQQVGISERDAVMLLDWILELFKTTLQKGEPIVIPNFGKFTVRSKPSRKGRNPATGAALMIPARRVVTFRASSQLKAEMNAVSGSTQTGVFPSE